MATFIHKRSPRRGVLLLLVLALLAMFGLLAISFVVLSGQARRGAEALSRAQESADPQIANSTYSPSALLDEAVAQVIRGSLSNKSVMGPHSLLDDIYGNDRLTGTIVAGNPPSVFVPILINGQLIDLPTMVDASTRIGSVLTITTPNSPAYNISFRIVGFTPATSTPPTPPKIRIFNDSRVPLWGPDGQPGRAGVNENTDPTIDDAAEFGALGTDDMVRVGDAFVINGVPFSGTGFGYNSAGTPPRTDGLADGYPLALQPNHLLNRVLFPGVNEDQPNEDYDAPDFQNMLLAMMLPDGRVPIPSLHRPELVQYWQNYNAGTPWNNPDFQRRVVLRPLSQDHPNFPAIDLVNGPWDVDNDGDGIPDSIWVDLGMTVRQTKDGRPYKPLFAILCLDMDGRLNLNAHGSAAQVASEYDVDVSGPFVGAALPGLQVPLPRGEGYGPAEIRIPPSVVPAAELARLLQGDSVTGIEGRYGEIAASSPQAGKTNTWDEMTAIRFFEFPENSYLDAVAGPILDFTKLTAFGAPPDLWGRGALGLDFAGNPLYWRPSTFNGMPENWWANEVLNNPYRLNLSPKGERHGARAGSVIDNPFTVAELERILRNYDADANRLPRRLLELAPSLVNRRTEVTTDSFDVPSPPANLSISPDMSPAPEKRVRGVAKLLYDKLGDNGVVDDNERLRQIKRMLSWDLLANRRMDVNRPLGNARDSDGNGVVDEWQEATSEAGWRDIFPFVGPIPPAPAGVTDTNNNGRIDWVTFWLTNAIDANDDGNLNAIDQPLARHLLARHLYVLAMLLAEVGYKPPSGPSDNLFFFPTPRETNLNDDDRRELTARRVAQWAVNVVDFRDADAIMTPFEYDINPFNGWDVDGNIDTNEGGERRVVWGMEAPELLITEVLAFHDRRVADTSFDSTGKKRTDDTDGDDVPDDVDLDQPLIPRGSAFFELYCPRNPNNPIAPSDLYTFNGGRWYLDVGRLAPPGGPGNLQYPVWRIVVSESRFANPDNDVYNRVVELSNNNQTPHSASLEPKQQRGTPGAKSKDGLSLLPGLTDANVEIDRIVWLAPLAPAPGHADRDRIYYNRKSTATQIPCGEYALVGPRFRTPIGGTTNLGEPSPHRIDLEPVGVIDNDGTDRYPTNAAIKPAVSIVAAADPPNNWGNNSPAADLDPNGSHGLSGAMRYGIGISISEPIPRVGNYYPEPTEANTRNGNLVEAYCDVITGKITGNPAIMDHPFDSEGGPGAGATRPLGKENLLRTQTTINYKTVFLQRLADPGRPYQPNPSQPGHNPYITVDWSPIDLTVFNGADRDPGEGAIPGNYRWDTYEDGSTVADNNSNAAADVQFASRQRGGHIFAAGANLWAWTDFAPPETKNTSETTLNFRHNLGWTETSSPDPTNQTVTIGQTLGYVNRGYGMPWAPPANPVLAEYRGTPATPMANPATTDLQPFPWLTWNNRPFANAFEILLVPSSSAARLCWEIAHAGGESDFYPGVDGSSNTPFFGVVFGQLLNFFQSDRRNANDPRPPKFYRLLDFIEVPSRFLGMETYLNPQFAGRTDLLEPHLNRPPFNAISAYREPGRVNINTIVSPDVWAGILNGHPGPSLDAVIVSRRGYGASNDPAEMDLSYQHPTVIANPFRSASCADLVPPMPKAPKQRPVNVTLLRARGIDPDADDTPLFADPATLGLYPSRGPLRNAYFRYESLARLGNLLTTRSNVYAVWITVGYFEAELNPGGVDAAHPDGYRLGRELGSDTGESVRHRAFYLIDRTIPVGFARGRDLNASNTILLKRFIE